MITLLSTTCDNIRDYSVSTEEELNSLNKDDMAPTSIVKLINNTEFRLFILNADKTNWVEL